MSGIRNVSLDARDKRAPVWKLESEVDLKSQGKKIELKLRDISLIESDDPYFLEPFDENQIREWAHFDSLYDRELNTIKQKSKISQIDLEQNPLEMAKALTKLNAKKLTTTRNDWEAVEVLTLQTEIHRMILETKEWRFSDTILQQIIREDLRKDNAHNGSADQVTYISSQTQTEGIIKGVQFPNWLRVSKVMNSGGYLAFQADLGRDLKLINDLSSNIVFDSQQVFVDNFKMPFAATFPIKITGVIKSIKIPASLLIEPISFEEHKNLFTWD